MKLKVNVVAIIIILVVILLLGLATWNYFASKGLVQFAPGDNCGPGKVICNQKCQLTGLVCSECGTGMPFKTANGCASSPGKIGG